MPLHQGAEGSIKPDEPIDLPFCSTGSSPPPKVEHIAQDFYPAARQMAGLGFKGRASRKNNSVFKLPQRDFDVVVLDPPTLTKSPFGAVDIVNDYASLAKPSLLCTRQGGGLLVATNHSST